MPVGGEPVDQSARLLLGARRRRRVAADHRQREPVEPPRRRPGPGIVEGVLRIDRRQRLHEGALRQLARIAHPPRRRDLAHQPVQADGVGADRRVALVHDGLAVDEREGAQRRDRPRRARRRRAPRRAARRASRAPSLEQEQRDRLRRQQRGVHDQRLDRGMELGGLLDGEREGLRHRQPVVILGRRVARVVEQSRRRRLEALAVVVERLLQPLAIGGRLLVRERQPAERLRQGLGGGALVGAAGAHHQIVGADRPWARCRSRPARRPRARPARSR